MKLKWWDFHYKISPFLSLPGGPKKNLTKTFSNNSGCSSIIRFLFNPHDALWLWFWRKRFAIVAYFRLTPQWDNREKASALLHAEHKVSEVANLVGVSRTTVYASKKRMDDGEGINRYSANWAVPSGDIISSNLQKAFSKWPPLRIKILTTCKLYEMQSRSWCLDVYFRGQ